MCIRTQALACVVCVVCVCVCVYLYVATNRGHYSLFYIFLRTMKSIPFAKNRTRLACFRSSCKQTNKQSPISLSCKKSFKFNLIFDFGFFHMLRLVQLLLNVFLLQFLCYDSDNYDLLYNKIKASNFRLNWTIWNYNFVAWLARSLAKHDSGKS